MTQIMADGIGADARAILDHFGPRQPVATYINGLASVWTPQEESWFGLKIRIGVEPGQPAQARFARVLDVSDNGDATPADIAPFCVVRSMAGHHDATPYTDLSTLAIDFDLFLPAPRIWIAWYWNEGQPVSADPLFSQLAAEGFSAGAIQSIRNRLWAWQYAAPGAGLPGEARWDLSAVFGTPDWSR